MAASDDSSIASAVSSIFGEKVPLEGLLWELCPVYFKVKCKEDFITVVSVCTSENGKKVYVKIYIVSGTSFHIHFRQLF